MFAPCAPPKSRLGRYRLLAPTAGVKVSPLCLGTMTFGTAWQAAVGECTKETSFKIMDTFYENGGNFIDTANNYQFEESEEWIGEWIETRGIRDEIVLATKYSSPYRVHKSNEIQANYVGNNTKALKVSIEASLRKLKTDYIDLLYVHYWDFGTSVEEVMTSLNHLVTSGKVLYLGVSDTPAWIGQWNAARRDFEREIIPMCAAEGMGLSPWGAIGGGAFQTAAQREEIAKSGTSGRRVQLTGADLAVPKVLETVAARHDTIITSVALAYVMSKAPYVVPMVGGRKVEHLQANIDALSLELSDRDIQEIESAYPFDHGFPMTFLLGGKPAHPKYSPFMNSAARFDYVDLPLAIKSKPVDEL